MIYRLLKRICLGIETERTRSPEHRGVINFIKRRITEPISLNTEIIVTLNNQCNLNCFSCSVIPNSDPYETSLTEVETYLGNLEGWKPHSGVLFSGGEITLMEPQKLSRIFAVTKTYNRNVNIITNGARKIDLSNVDMVLLDNHGVNKERIKEYEKILDDLGIEYRTKAVTYHMDNEYARQNNISPGPGCKNWMRSVNLWRGAVYPCCEMPNLDAWDKNRDLEAALKFAGWTYDNPSLVNHIENWHHTLPPMIYKKCTLSCWFGSNNVRWGKIE